MNRKPPCKHKVKSHTRKGGIKVQSYTRGSGSKPYKITKRRVVGKVTDETEVGPKPFTVNFMYSKRRGDGESVVVIADTYERALDEAFEEKVDSRWPIEVEIVDPSLGAVLKFIGEGAKRVGGLTLKGIRKMKPKVQAAARIGAKYAMRGGHIAKQKALAIATAGYRAAEAAVSESAKFALSKLQTQRVRFLLKDAYSEDPIKRRAARYSLKRYYPDVYDVCSFSRDRNISQRKKSKKRKKARKRRRTKPQTYTMLPQRYVPIIIKE